MASIGYEYEPEPEFDENIEESEEIQGVEQGEEFCFSTKLEELDRIDLINRNSEEINQVINPEVFNPDPLAGKSLFVKTVPPGGVLGRTYQPPVVNEMIEDRQESINELSKKENDANYSKYERQKITSMNVGEFVKFLADSYINIINDLLEINSLDGFVETFIKEDRLVAIGILFLSISIFFIFFNQL